MTTINDHDDLEPGKTLYCAVQIDKGVCVAEAEIDRVSEKMIWLKTKDGMSSSAFGWRRTLRKVDLEAHRIATDPQGALKMMDSDLTAQINRRRKTLKKIIHTRKQARDLLL